MATFSHITTIPTQQSPGAEVLTSPGRFHSDCRTAVDVWARAARVRAFRAQVFQPQRLPAVTPVPAAKLPVPPVPKASPRVLLASTIVPVIVADNDNVPAAIPGRITVARVMEVTAQHFGLPIDHLLADIRTQPLCRRRQIAMYVAHRTTGRSLVFIGKRMAGRDHTTILHGVRAVQARLDAGDVETAAAVKAIVEQVTGGANG